MKEETTFEEDLLALRTLINEEYCTRGSKRVQKHGQISRELELSFVTHCPTPNIDFTEESGIATAAKFKDDSHSQKLENTESNNKTSTTTTTKITTPSWSESFHSIYSCNYCKPKNVVFLSSHEYKLHLARYHCEHFFPEERSKAAAVGILEDQFKRICSDLNLFQKFKGQKGQCKLCQTNFGKMYAYFKLHLVNKHIEELREQLESEIQAGTGPRSKENDPVKVKAFQSCTDHAKENNENQAISTKRQRTTIEEVDVDIRNYSNYQLIPCDQCQRLMMREDFLRHKALYCHKRP